MFLMTKFRYTARKILPGMGFGPTATAACHKCPHCSHSYKWKSGLKRHLQLRHAGPKTVRFVCAFCNTEGARPDIIRRHVAIQHPEEDPHTAPITRLLLPRVNSQPPTAWKAPPEARPQVIKIPIPRTSVKHPHSAEFIPVSQSASRSNISPTPSTREMASKLEHILRDDLLLSSSDSEDCSSTASRPASRSSTDSPIDLRSSDGSMSPICTPSMDDDQSTHSPGQTSTTNFVHVPNQPCTLIHLDPSMDEDFVTTSATLKPASPALTDIKPLLSEESRRKLHGLHWPPPHYVNEWTCQDLEEPKVDTPTVDEFVTWCVLDDVPRLYTTPHWWHSPSKKGPMYINSGYGALRRRYPFKRYQ